MPHFPRLAPDDGILLAPADVAALDQHALADGIPGTILMERAGQAVVRALTLRFAKRPVLVACGPGNNGGDGWVIARTLRDAGWPVRVTSLVDPSRLQGDAAQAAAAWSGPVETIAGAKPGETGLIVDALFGAGLGRDVDGDAARLLSALGDLGKPVVAVDIPSGIDGATGAVRGMALRATLTVTFVRKKPGLVLLPGRNYAGEIVTADIGIDERHLRRLAGKVRVDQPGLWLDQLPRRDTGSHKYRFGHALAIGGPADATGAIRMTAVTALRIGAGLVTIAAEPEAIPFYAAEQADLITRRIDVEADLDRLLADQRINAVAIGPAAGVGRPTGDRIDRILTAGKHVVLDADALASLAPVERELVGAHRVVLTPHEGEFAKLFPKLVGTRIERARQAAEQSGAVVVLKGGDSIVAAPGGQVAICDVDAPALATAGAGDVLTGAILGLLAQGMPPFLAAAAAVRLHAEAGAALGPGLTASDLPRAIAKRSALHQAGSVWECST